MSDKPTFEAIRADVAELVSQCPSRAPHDIAVYLMAKNYRYGIVCAMCSLTEDNCYVNVSDDEDELIDYIAKAVAKHWGEPAYGFAECIIMDTFEVVFHSAFGWQAAKHYAEWITTEAYNLSSDTWSVRIDKKSEVWRVGFVHSSDCKPSFYDLYDARHFNVQDHAERFARMLSAISGYPMG